MISCTKENGTYTLTGLLPNDLDIIQEAIIRLFNESSKAEHRGFRTQVLRINRAIDPEIEKNLREAPSNSPKGGEQERKSNQ